MRVQQGALRISLVFELVRGCVFRRGKTQGAGAQPPLSTSPSSDYGLDVSSVGKVKEGRPWLSGQGPAQ